MKLIFAILGSGLIMPCAFAREDSLLARVTVYWASGGSGSDHNTRNHRCATGLRLRSGHCAVDPRHIPYGSRVVLPNGEALAAVDTGSAVKSRKAARQGGRTASEKSALVIDRFFETKRQAMAWANTHPAFMPVKVVRPNLRAPASMPLFAGQTRDVARTHVVAGNPKSVPASSPPILTASNSSNSSAIDWFGRMGH